MTPGWGKSLKELDRAELHCHMPWQSLLPAGKMLLVKNDPSRDILKLSPSSLNRRQRILLTKTAELATAEATSHASLKQAREYVRLQKSGTLEKLKQLINELDGLQGTDGLVFNGCSTDPAVFISQPRSGGVFSSGGPCPTHQDYDVQSGAGKTGRCVQFCMLLQDVTQRDGATYVYPYSRHLKVRVRDQAEPVRQCRGRPRKRRRADIPPEQDGLNQHALDRDLAARCGDCIVLEGQRLTVFRFEGGEWHGALANSGDGARAVLMWSYCSPHLRGHFAVLSS